MDRNRNGWQEADRLNAISILNLLLKKLHWLFLAGMAGGLIVLFFVKTFVTPTFESRVSFYVYNTSDTAVRTGTINNNDLQAAESLATTYSKILSSNTVRSAVLEELGTDSLTRKDLEKMVKIAVIDDTQLLEVVVSADDAQEACDIASAYAGVAPTEIIRITKAGGVEVVDQPEVAVEKAKPRTVFDTAVGLVIGVIAAAVFFILKMISDRKIYFPEDLENMPGVTVLGMIPEIAASEAAESRWKVVEGGTIRVDGKKADEEDFF